MPGGAAQSCVQPLRGQGAAPKPHKGPSGTGCVLEEPKGVGVETQSDFQPPAGRACPLNCGRTGETRLQRSF